jgi:hypothetical protein
MKPKRPTETDLLAIVQNGFQEQLPKDREAQLPAPASTSAPASTPVVAPIPMGPMVRITLAIPEDLRYRLKLAVMNHRRKNQDKITQDEFCAQAIATRLDLMEGSTNAAKQVEPLVSFLQECLRDRGLARGWAPKAKTLLENLDKQGL